jgi:predicted lipoprotein with Yx(FWY)xxD motif
MSRPIQVPRRTGLRAAGRSSLSVAIGAIAVAALIASVAGAAGVSRVVSAATNSKLKETIVVDTHGRTLYALHAETTHHLLCRSRACFEAWPPLTVRSAGVKLKGSQGVEGHLALLHRSDGKLQVTLRGMPLYRFSGDSARGQANGEGIKAFGGTWHAVTAEAHGSSTPSGTTTTPASTPPMTPAYGY